MADGTTDGSSDDETGRAASEAEVGAAVDEALELELKRQKARFVQRILSIDRREGVGRIHERWDDSFDEQLDPDRPHGPDS